jgi:hypothetical protein
MTCQPLLGESKQRVNNLRLPYSGLAERKRPQIQRITAEIGPKGRCESTDTGFFRPYQKNHYGSPHLFPASTYPLPALRLSHLNSS